MGFFSQDCNHCGHPLLSTMAATRGVNEWMTEGVALLPNGSVIVGVYDGYGRLNDLDAVGFEATVYHKACWDLVDRPNTYAGPSRHSDDQGWFFADEDHALTAPPPVTSAW